MINNYYSFFCIQTPKSDSILISSTVLVDQHGPQSCGTQNGKPEMETFYND